MISTRKKTSATFVSFRRGQEHIWKHLKQIMFLAIPITRHLHPFTFPFYPHFITKQTSTYSKHIIPNIYAHHIPIFYNWILEYSNNISHRIHGAAMVTWIPSIYPMHVSIFLPAPLGSGIRIHRLDNHSNFTPAWRRCPETPDWMTFRWISSYKILYRYIRLYSLYIVMVYNGLYHIYIYIHWLIVAYIYNGLW